MALVSFYPEPHRKALLQCNYSPLGRIQAHADLETGDDWKTHVCSSVVRDVVNSDG